MRAGVKGRKLQALVGASLAALAATPATAQETVWVGGNSSDWFAPGNWTPSGAPSDGNDVAINTSMPNPTIIAAAGARSRNIRIGSGAGANGRLTIQNGGALVTTGDARIGETGGNGTVTVTGAGSSWTIGGGLNIANSPVSNHVGRLLVENGATVTSASAGIFRSTNIQTADGAATISGAGSV